MDQDIIKITNEQEAWDLLDRALNGEQFPENIQLVFDGWPTWGMRITGHDWQSSVPTRIMAPLLEVQKDIYRSYTSSVYGTTNIKRLTNEERDDLELIVKVDKGSSDYKAELFNQLTMLASKMVSNMNGTESLIAILGIALAVSGTIVTKSWIASRQQEKQLDQTVKLSEQETERMKILARAAKSEPLVEATIENVEDSQNKILKTLKPNDSINFNDVSLDAGQAKEIAQADRAKSEDIDIQGLFAIQANDTTHPGGFKIKVSRVSDGIVFNAIVPIELSIDQRNLIQDAEWSKGDKIIKLSITASILKGKIQNAVVYSAEELEE